MTNKDYLSRQEKKIKDAKDFIIPRLAKKLEVIVGYSVIASWILLAGYGLYQGASATIDYVINNYNHAAPSIEDIAQDLGDIFDDLIS